MIVIATHDSKTGKVSPLSVPVAHQILARVAAAYDVSVADVISTWRDPLLVEARRVAMCLLADQGMGPTEIGHLVHRDHSTVAYHLMRTQSSMTPEEQDMLRLLRRTT